MIIAISGLPGSGTSTVSMMLSERIDVEVGSAGDIFRKMAEERGLALEEFGKLASCDVAIDQRIDQYQREIASHARDTKKSIILEGRLSAWMVQPDLAIFIAAPLDIRAARVAHREKIPIAGAIEHIKEREACEAERYKRYYGVDVNDLKIYDLVINSEKWDQHGVVRIVMAAIDAARIRPDPTL